VTVELNDPFHLVAGGGEPLVPKEPLSALSGRLSTSAVLTGTIKYPQQSRYREETGTLVVAKAALTPEMPYEVLSYAQSNPVFPHDSTADQWFNVGQFDAYQAIGRHIGLAAADTMRKRLASTPASGEGRGVDTSMPPAGHPEGDHAARPWQAIAAACVRLYAATLRFRAADRVSPGRTGSRADNMDGRSAR
jgi:hypothetical protein